MNADENQISPKFNYSIRMQIVFMLFMSALLLNISAFTGGSRCFYAIGVHRRLIAFLAFANVARRFPAALCTTCLAFTALACAAQPAAERYPAKPIRFIVPQPPSGTVDMLARMLGQKLAEALRQQVVIDNRGGASGTIGSDLVAKAPPDGYTILMTMTSHTTTPSMYAKLPYDPIKDFVPVTMVTSAALILVVNPALPVHTVKDLIALAKAKPDQINFTSAAIGSGGHLGGELLKSMTGMTATHVPYRGTGPAIIALIANEVQFMFAGLLPAQAQVKTEADPKDAKKLTPDDVWSLVDYVRSLPNESISRPPQRTAENTRERH